MITKKLLNVYLSESDMVALESATARHGISKAQFVREAVAFYMLARDHVKREARLTVTAEDGAVSELKIAV